jgi:hypothetical protein
MVFKIVRKFSVVKFNCFSGNIYFKQKPFE